MACAGCERRRQALLKARREIKRQAKELAKATKRRLTIEGGKKDEAG